MKGEPMKPKERSSPNDLPKPVFGTAVPLTLEEATAWAKGVGAQVLYWLPGAHKSFASNEPLALSAPDTLRIKKTSAGRGGILSAYCFHVLVRDGVYEVVGCRLDDDPLYQRGSWLIYSGPFPTAQEARADIPREELMRVRE